MNTKELAVTTAAIIPKPTKREVRMAMAKVLHSEAVKEASKADAEYKKDKIAISKEVVRYVKRNGLPSRSDEGHFNFSIGTSISITLEVSNFESPEFVDLKRRASKFCGWRRSIASTVESIYSDLIKAEINGGDAVEKMLANPVIYKALAKVGNELLNKKNNQDAVAI
jgi:hypothetical protein